MSVTINGTSGVTFNDSSSQTTAATGFGFKNRIINGAMVIDQRNAGASVTQTSSGGVFYSVDRMIFSGSVGNKFSAQQSSVAPTGFVKSVLFTSLSAYTVGASEFFGANQRIEGFNIGDLGWGTANAATVTLSFQVRSSLTGTFGGALYSYSGDVSYPFSYTISSANTWTSISITIAGPTTGTFPTDNSGSLVVNFSLGSGSTVSGTAGSWSSTLYRSATGATSVVGTNGATFYITGVQLEKGSTATSFDYRPYGTELQLCQRYLPAYKSGTTGEYVVLGHAKSTSAGLYNYPFAVTPRVAPTGITISSAAHFYTLTGNTGIGAGVATAMTFQAATLIAGTFDATATTAALTTGQGSFLYANSTSAQILFTGCEL
jgi:hypothetical protein